MNRQAFLLIPAAVANRKGEAPRNAAALRLITWNLRNPSVRRAEEQILWLMERGADVLVLTEVKATQAAELHRCALLQQGYTVLFPDGAGSDYCVLVAVRAESVKPGGLTVSFLPHRAVAVDFETPIGPLTVIGLYVPSRGPREQRNVNKKRFQEAVALELRSFARHASQPLVVAGDLNVLEPDHEPHYPVFEEWEYDFYRSFLSLGMVDAFRALHPGRQAYSWFGRAGNGYRFDHAFVSRCLGSRLDACGYNSDAVAKNLSDHAAMELALHVDRGVDGSKPSLGTTDNIDTIS